jgi:hypothetical protein
MREPTPRPHSFFGSDYGELAHIMVLILGPTDYVIFLDSETGGPPIEPLKVAVGGDDGQWVMGKTDDFGCFAFPEGLEPKILRAISLNYVAAEVHVGAGGPPTWVLMQRERHFAPVDADLGL